MRVPEPWLRGPLEGVHPFLQPTLHSLQQVREDLARWTEALTDEQVWRAPLGQVPFGFQLRHIAGSLDRLTTYLEGKSLTTTQLVFLASEKEPGAGLAELMAGVEAAIQRAEAVVRGVDPGTLTEPRTVGRQGMPTTVIGLVVHLAEHTQRHLGQAISAAKLAGGRLRRQDW